MDVPCHESLTKPEGHPGKRLLSSDGGNDRRPVRCGQKQTDETRGVSLNWSFSASKPTEEPEVEFLVFFLPQEKIFAVVIFPFRLFSEIPRPQEHLWLVTRGNLKSATFYLRPDVPH